MLIASLSYLTGISHSQANRYRAQAEERMFAKLANPRFLTDLKPLLPAVQAEALTDASTKAAFVRVFERLVVRISGDPWVRTGEMKQRFGL